MNIGDIILNNKIINRYTGMNPIGIITHIFDSKDRAMVIDITSGIDHVWIIRECRVISK
jgi:hypothetical protein